MITATNVSFSFPNKDLYNHVSFTIEQGQSCAFIGSSGGGKSTLAEIIQDPEKHVFDGKIDIASGCKIGYIRQHFDVDPTLQLTVFDYVAQEFVQLQDAMTDVCKAMETATDLDPLLEKYQQILDATEAIDGDNYESNIHKKLNLSNLMDKRDLQVTKLSGGEFKLVQVIKEMLTNPHFIILDEPDSFLDFDNLNALKNLLNTHKGTTLTITHSRYLLNHCFNKILHLENKKIQEYDGNYIDYNFALLASKVELEELAFADTQETERNDALIAKLLFLAEHYDSPTNGRALHARMKIQKRLQARRIQNPFINISQPAIAFRTPEEPLETSVLSVDNLSISYEQPLLHDVSFEIAPTDKVAIIGANGTGKTSLMRAICSGKHPEIKLHEQAQVSYLLQNQEENFSNDATLFDAFFDLGFPSYDAITEYLGTFGFEAEKMAQKIGSLSGGEKNILGLAKLSSQTSNLLVLDEPTSHLDTYAQLALEQALCAYQGAVLMISHDFYSIVNCMDYVLILENNTVRKMQMRKFRKMIYAKHFDKDYLQLEQSKKTLETKIESTLHQHDFETAKLLVDDLEKIVVQM